MEKGKSEKKQIYKPKIPLKSSCLSDLEDSDSRKVGILKPLVSVPYENLRWSKFKQFNLIRISIFQDGSCMFHSICKAYFKPYITGKIGDKSFDRNGFIKDLRQDLADKLPNYYDKLSKGELKKMSQTIPECSLEYMQKELADTSASLSVIYNEYIGNQLKLDIYILNADTHDVYMTGTDDKLLYKNRPSIVLLYLPPQKGISAVGHYELIGLMHRNNNIETYFSPDSPLIQHIKSRMNILRE